MVQLLEEQCELADFWQQLLLQLIERGYDPLLPNHLTLLRLEQREGMEQLLEGQYVWIGWFVTTASSSAGRERIRSTLAELFSIVMIGSMTKGPSSSVKEASSSIATAYSSAGTERMWSEFGESSLVVIEFRVSMTKGTSSAEASSSAINYKIRKRSLFNIVI